MAVDRRAIQWGGGLSDLGPFRLGVSAAGIAYLSFADEAVPGNVPFVDEVAYAIAHPQAPHGLPLDPMGSGFQQAVWRAVCAIPPGETRSYGQIAAQIGRPKAARAVGAANGANPIAVLIPCHRLVRTSGALAGYAYGLDRKRALLEKEHNMIINRGA